uniref:Small ribosomal subunit protein bS18c n=1 Tax=Dicloster acuatus TaxID=91190 RepID=A0A097KQI5_9CHLO|nr:ribosomal protein S18 [Dicloster acuatus]AIT95448.1 ribosomal protein S18 [Dicloster acuatus]
MVIQKRKNIKSNKSRRKPIPVIISKKGQGTRCNMNETAPRYLMDYKNTKLLVKFISPQGKILPRRATGLNAKQQRYMANAIKRARMGGLLPFVNLDIFSRKID